MKGRTSHDPKAATLPRKAGRRLSHSSTAACRSGLPPVPPDQARTVGNAAGTLRDQLALGAAEELLPAEPIEGNHEDVVGCRAGRRLGRGEQGEQRDGVHRSLRLGDAMD
jgi:hypothetical protein